MFGFLGGIWGKLIAAGTIALAILAAIGKIFYAGKSAGKAAVVNDINAGAAKTQEKFDAIDAQSPDVDAAVNRLHRRNDH